MKGPTASALALAGLTIVLSHHVGRAQTAEPAGVTQHTALAAKAAQTT
ncbi:MAG: hypothetical protein JOY90_33750 [Bradyrhizobium sp.]|nr:hypothetical protein [Bradyrhizobium sp.]MBV9565381.1 hypothetical protein [Bradyrhizobium sp.]